MMIDKSIETTSNPSVKSVINVSPEFQEQLLEQVLLQSGGISVGVILSFCGAIFLAKYLGVGKLIAGLVDRVEKGTDSLKEVSQGLSRLNCDLTEANRVHVVTHENILNKVDVALDRLQESKELIKDIQRKLDK
ncbi:hypothetical protein [Dolichospermum sp. UHCC 0684]|uniref:hypothetical protein n=1 Tax=Dolichospermum sp. UHCC 0684 TaxID=3110242 RepID=UPI002B20F9E4|nr:hypothetical protein [Dolichospermum sp. UHCC 0684]